MARRGWRRGEPVAVLLSATEPLALTGEGPPFVGTLARLRERLRVQLATCAVVCHELR